MPNDIIAAVIGAISNIDIKTFYVLFLLLSILTVLTTGVISYIRSRLRKKKRFVLTGLHVMTIGTFLACFLIHLPFYLRGYFFGDDLIYSRPLVMSAHSTLQAFVLGFNYSDIIKELPDISPFWHAFYTGWLAALYVFAPLLTLSNILSLFNDLRGELKIRRNKRKTLYIFSELNEKSIAVAESIADRNKALKKERKKLGFKKRKECEKPRKSLFVFTDCYIKNEEIDQDLLQAAQNLKAVCVKKDVTQLKLKKNKYKIEFFLIGDNENENIEQTIKLNDEYKTSDKCSVYVYSSAPGAGLILDSLDKGEKNISKRSVDNSSARDYLKDKESALKMFSLEKCYYIRRVNIVDAFTAKALTDEQLMTHISKQAKEKHEISIMIVGLGTYGMYFLKNALWLYQLYGCCLNIRVLEAKDKETLHKIISKEIPAVASCLSKKKNSRYLRYRSVKEGGDCQFDIRIYHSIDCEYADMEELFAKQAKNPESHPETFFDIRAIFVTLGDDSKNIKTAVEMRRVIDRISGIKDKSVKKLPDELPMIYSVVYDNKTSSNLNSGKTKNGLINFNDVPYHIHFIGQMADHFNYSVITDMKEREKRAIVHHFGWIYNEAALRKWFRPDPAFVAEADQTTKDMLTAFHEEMKQYFKEKEGRGKDDKEDKIKEDWNDKYLYDSENPVNFNNIYDPQNLIPEYIIKLVRNYADYEYYRDSSVSKEFYCSEIRDKYYSDYFTDLDEKFEHRETIKEVCSCPTCLAQRINEHMRWNAYMAANGYRYNKDRNDRARMHCNMIPWEDLPASDRYKD